MRSRFRLAAALLALLSLTVAEGVWASTCMPGTAMGAAPARMVAAPTAHAAALAMPTPAGAEWAHGSATDPSAPETTHCPLAPVSGSCITLATSIAAHAPEPFAPSPEGTLAIVIPEDVRHILLVSPFFRPPRA